MWLSCYDVRRIVDFIWQYMPTCLFYRPVYCLPVPVLCSLANKSCVSSAVDMLAVTWHVAVCAYVVADVRQHVMSARDCHRPSRCVVTDADRPRPSLPGHLSLSASAAAAAVPLPRATVINIHAPTTMIGRRRSSLGTYAAAATCSAAPAVTHL